MYERVFPRITYGSMGLLFQNRIELTEKQIKLPWEILPLNEVFSLQSTQLFIFLTLIKY